MVRNTIANLEIMSKHYLRLIKNQIISFAKPTKRLEASYLIFVIIVVMYEIFLSFNPEFLNSAQSIHSEKFSNEIANFRKNLIPKDKDYYNNKKDIEVAKRYDTIQLFDFNPNTASFEDFTRLGLTEKQINSILNYREKGGIFKVKSDFGKIYTLQKSQYKILSPYISLAGSFNNFEPSDDTKAEKKQEKELSKFDPNTASKEKFLKLGLTEKQINTIDNYLSKGGKFKDKNDFKKMYVISNEQYAELEPYIEITLQTNTEISKPEIKELKTENFVAELNTASVEDLIKIKGIGKFSAQKIVEYRQQLGGFVKIEQLMEVNGMYENNFIKAKEYLTLNTSKIIKININLADFKELVNHPYLEKEDVLKILKYREKKGKFTNLSQLTEKEILPEALFQKLKPYLKI